MGENSRAEISAGACVGESQRAQFAPVENQDKKGELRPYYSLTKTECLYTVAIRDTAYW